MGLGGHARLPGVVGVRGPDVRHVHLQLHRTHDRHSARRRPVRVQPARVRPDRRLSSPASPPSSSSCSRRPPSRSRSAPTCTCSTRGSSRAGSPSAPTSCSWRSTSPACASPPAVELVVTLVAIVELLVFMGVVAPGFSAAGIHARRLGRPRHVLAWPASAASSPRCRSRSGSSSRSRASRWRPRKCTIRSDRFRAPTSAASSRSWSLAAGVMIFAGGVGDWTQLANINDPLPQAMKRVVGANSGWLHMLLWLGLFGLVASFHGIIIGYSRQMFALARAGYLPRGPGRIHPRFHTPHVAILAGGVVGIAAIFSDGLVHIARPDADGLDRDDVGVRRDRDVHRQHGEPVPPQAQPAGPGAAVPGARSIRGCPASRWRARRSACCTMVYYNPQVALVVRPHDGRRTSARTSSSAAPARRRRTLTEDGRASWRPTRT